MLYKKPVLSVALCASLFICGASAIASAEGYEAQLSWYADGRDAVYYSTLEEAVAAATTEGGYNIKLLKNCDVSSLANDKLGATSLAIDLGGYILAAENGDIDINMGACVFSNGIIDGDVSANGITLGGVTVSGDITAEGYCSMRDKAKILGDAVFLSTGYIENGSTVNGAFSYAGTDTYNIGSGVYNGTISASNGGTLTVSGGTFAYDPVAYLRAGSTNEANNAICKINDDGTYTVSTGSRAINGEGIYKSRVAGDTYEQMGVFRTTLGPEDHDIIFNVNDNPVTMRLDTTVNSSDVLIGLIVTDIPENQTVTITMD